MAGNAVRSFVVKGFGCMAGFAVAVLAASLLAVFGVGDARATQLAYNDNWSLNLDRVSVASDGGASSARVNVDWSLLERVQGEYRWGGVDRTVSALEAVGIKPYLVVTNSPQWARPYAPNSPPPPPDDAHLEDWATVNSEIAARYHLPIEVWNEPLYGMHAGRYAQIFRVAADAIHSVNPDERVISGGNFQRGGWGQYQRKFAEQTQDLRYTVGLHVYARRDHCLAGCLAVKNVAGNVNWAETSVRRIRRVEGDRPIWVTEMGISTGDVTPKMQSKILGAMYTTLSGLGIQVITIHRLFDDLGFRPGNFRERGYPLIYDSGRPKPAYHRLSRIVSRSGRGVRSQRHR